MYDSDVKLNYVQKINGSLLCLLCLRVMLLLPAGMMAITTAMYVLVYTQAGGIYGS